MNVMIIGYGKMGKLLEQMLVEKGHQITLIIDQDNSHRLDNLSDQNIDVAIEFSTPSAAFDNVSRCIQNGIPVVCGTTAWLDKKNKIEELCKQHGGAFFYAPNYSIGVNLFFKACSHLGRLMNAFDDYEVSIEEIHHLQKLDAPSGTAIVTAERLLEQLDRKKKWSLDNDNGDTIWIQAQREPEVPGTHSVRFHSAIDTIELKHTAHNRRGFASGAIIAAEWLFGKQGIFGMDDLLSSID